MDMQTTKIISKIIMTIDKVIILTLYSSHYIKLEEYTTLTPLQVKVEVLSFSWKK